MNASWQTFLESLGAVIQSGRVQHFGDASIELRYALDQTIVADLSDLSLIQFAGEDAQTYLQGQFSNDLRQLDGGNSQLSSYCTPKGRMLANFLLWQNAQNSYLAQLPASLREPIQKRLSMFVLRSKVKVSDVSDAWVRLGVGGPGAQAVVTSVLGESPSTVHGLVHHASGSILRLPGDLFELLIAPDQASAIWRQLTTHAKAVGTACWDGLMIRAGIPTILPGTQEAFVPQMVNYELIDGVNFKKGCYPGQEIVARTQYLGKLKRRMYVGNLTLNSAPLPGDELFSAEMADQAVGMIVNAAPAPTGGYDVLAVIQIASVENAIRWKSLDGPTLKLGVLPYTIPA
ncbi:MAG: folate-binding protein YgfZ [Burkholderiales bacterium]|nr:folate-binding protein YgfZ [Burkholderiales bacterium]